MPKQRKSVSAEALPPLSAEAETMPKHQRVFEYLQSGIRQGSFKPGDRLPSEAELGKLFDASRITVAKAVLELQRLGLVTRRPGAGTHVLAQQKPGGYTFGLLIPELGLTEIFEPICHGMMRSPFGRPDQLLWGNVSGASGAAATGAALNGAMREIAKEAEHMGHSFITQKVAGVFFAPLELTPDKDAANRRIIRALERARIPTVLLDRCYLPYPERSQYDLVGVDNRRTGYLAADHLIGLGVRRLAFVGEVHSAATVDARVTGFLEALRAHGIRPEREPVWRGSPQDVGFVRGILDASQPEGIVCANDVTAARLMQTLLQMGLRIPEEVRIVGIDDVKYASLLPVPLTTLHQDCAAIGAIAIATMLERLEHPELPTREIMLPTRLVVRRSCGAGLA